VFALKKPLATKFQFPFLSHRRNISPNENASYLKKCVYDPVTDPLCPIFELGTIVEEAGEDYNTVAYKVILIKQLIIVFLLWN